MICCIGVFLSIVANDNLFFAGGHVNPAVTFASFLTKKVSLLTGIFYIASQLLGGSLGCWLISIVSFISISLPPFRNIVSYLLSKNTQNAVKGRTRCFKFFSTYSMSVCTDQKQILNVLHLYKSQGHLPFQNPSSLNER